MLKYIYNNLSLDELRLGPTSERTSLRDGMLVRRTVPSAPSTVTEVIFKLTGKPQGVGMLTLPSTIDRVFSTLMFLPRLNSVMNCGAFSRTGKKEKNA